MRSGRLADLARRRRRARLSRRLDGARGAVDGGTASSVEVRQFDGLHWEECIAGSGAAIKAFSVDEPCDEPCEELAADEAPETPEELSPPESNGTKPPRAPSTTLAWLFMLFEAIATFLVPLVLILLVARNGGPAKRGPWFLPGKPQP